MRKTTNIVLLTLLLWLAATSAALADNYSAQVQLDGSYAGSYNYATGERQYTYFPGMRLYGSYFKLYDEQPLLVSTDIRLIYDFSREIDDPFAPYVGLLMVHYGNEDGAAQVSAGRFFGRRILRSTYFDGVVLSSDALGPVNMDLYAGRNMVGDRLIVNAENITDVTRVRTGLAIGYQDGADIDTKVAFEMQRRAFNVLQPYVLAAFYGAGSTDPERAAKRGWSYSASAGLPLLNPTMPEADANVLYQQGPWEQQLTYQMMSPDLEPESIFWAFHPVAQHSVEYSVERALTSATDIYDEDAVVLGASYRVGFPAWIASTFYKDTWQILSHLGQLSVRVPVSDHASIQPTMFGEKTTNWRAVGLYVPYTERIGIVDAGVTLFGEVRHTGLGDQGSGLFGGGSIAASLELPEDFAIQLRTQLAAGGWLGTDYRAMVGVLWQH